MMMNARRWGMRMSLFAFALSPLGCAVAGDDASDVQGQADIPAIGDDDVEELANAYEWGCKATPLKPTRSSGKVWTRGSWVCDPTASGDGNRRIWFELDKNPPNGGWVFTLVSGYVTPNIPWNAGNTSAGWTGPGYTTACNQNAAYRTSVYIWSSSGGGSWSDPGHGTSYYYC